MSAALFVDHIFHHATATIFPSTIEICFIIGNLTDQKIRWAYLKMSLHELSTPCGIVRNHGLTFWFRELLFGNGVLRSMYPFRLLYWASW